MEYFAEWMLSPKNVVFLRVQTSVYDPLLIGDKPKWYAHQLQPIEFKVYDEGSSLGTALSSSSSIYSDENPTGINRFLLIYVVICRKAGYIWTGVQIHFFLITK